MTEPVIAAKSPCGVELEPGSYWWCSCGRSKAQPFCDGSHSGTGFSPMEVVVKEKGTVWLCACKHTKTPPYCDGTHSKL